MRCALLTFADPSYTYERMPRGTFAYLHFLEQFGHVVRFWTRSDCRHPGRFLADVRMWNPDVILAQHAGALLAAVWRRRRWLKSPVVHAWDDYYAEQSRIPFLLAWPLERLSVQWADRVTSVSAYNVYRARRWGVSAHYIPHGVHGEERETSLCLDAPGVKVVYLGDQSWYKGMGRLMRAMRQCPDATLFLIGDVNRELKKRAPGNVRFTGRVPPEEVPAVLRQADILVNPSDQDSNFKLQEYVRAGRSILGLRGRMEHVFTHGMDAWLVRDLGQGLCELARNPTLRARLAEGVRRRSVLSWEESVRRLEQVLMEAVSRGTP